MEIFACQLGGAAFFDVGDAANGFDKLHMRQSAGFGFRILFPQLIASSFEETSAFPWATGANPPRTPPRSLRTPSRLPSSRRSRCPAWVAAWGAPPVVGISGSDLRYHSGTARAAFRDTMRAQGSQVHDA